MINSGTGDAIALLKVVTQRALNANRDIISYFIVYEKAFDRVNHDQLIEILKKFI